MSSEAALAIEVCGLSKKYVVGAGTRGYRTLRESLAYAARAPSRRLQPLLRRESATASGGDTRDFWALRDLDLEIRQGETVGLIGRNGAGKTTLLKVLSRITEPTSGWAEIRGRVGSLLEVGTGFHPELTGRENIWLNGAILGMRRGEIRCRFDEIVEFAGVSDFLETPVKRYSSGMYVRLAFAVAAHLEPEILIVDEVLAVGDVEFQRKCLGKMSEVADEGRTVLFVSHNMSIVQALCDRGIVMHQGRVVLDSDVNTSVRHYLRMIEQAAATTNLLERSDRDSRGWNDVMLREVRVTGPDPESAPSTGAPARMVFGLHWQGPPVRTDCKAVIHNYLGHPIITLDSSIHSGNDTTGSATDEIVCDIDELLLVPGRYRLDVTLRAAGRVQDGLEAAATFDVEEGLVRGRPVAVTGSSGDLLLPHRWTGVAT